MTHDHSPEVREVAAIRLQAAQRARITCHCWILHQTGMPTDMKTRLWNHLQLLLPSQHHAILTNHTCPEEEPLAVLCRDLHHHPMGIIHTTDFVGASITVVYVTLSQMRVLHHTGAHHTPFPQLPEWPKYRLLRQYLTQSSRPHPARKHRHAGSLPRFQKATPPTRPSDTALRTHRLETRTRPPGDGPSPTTNPTTGPE